MQRVIEYLKHASDCLSMAASAKSESVRAQLVDVAIQWSELAAEQERFLKTKADTDSRRH